MSTRKEEWRDIPGYDGFYQISDWGRVRSFRANDTHHPGSRTDTPKLARVSITGCKDGKNQGAKVSLRKPGAKESQSVSVPRLVAMTWLGGIPDGARAYHRDGNPANNSRWNIAIGWPNKVMNKTLKPTRKTVVKIDLSLEIVDCYSGVRAAARANGLVHGSVRSYCNLTTKTIIAPDGYIYAWDDDNWLRKTLRKARVELDALGIRYNDPHTERYYDLQEAPDLDLDPDIMWSEAPACGGGHPFGINLILIGA